MKRAARISLRALTQRRRDRRSSRSFIRARRLASSAPIDTRVLSFFAWRRGR